MSEGERLNFYRLSLLIMDGGTPALKWLFEKQYAASGDLEIFLKSRTTVLDGLHKRKIINLKQMDLLRPSTGIKPSVEKFDTSLLMTLLTSICPIQQPHCGWTVSPAASDLCTGADILRVRDARNNLFHHARCGISDAEFQLESSNVSDAISRLSRQLDQQQQENIQKIINDARHAARDFGREKEICNLIFLDKIDEIHHLVQGIYDRGKDGAIAGLAVSEASHSLPKDEKNDGTKDQPDIDMRFTLGENSIIIVVKLYADLKKELTREIVMSIAKVLFKEENSTDVLEEIEKASSRRLCIDTLLKRVIHREAATVQSFLMEIKSKCPAMANLLAKTIITEEDRKKFQLIDDRVQRNGRISSRVHTRCRIDEADVKFFEDHLCDLPENIDKIADVLLSKFYLSFSDHSKVTLQSDVFTRIRVLFEKIRLCHLDSVSELECVLGSELYKKWIEFRNETSGPNGENMGIWQTIIQRICGAAASLMESICQTFHIDFIRSERGSLVLIFKAGDNFSIELLKPESVKKKVRELLEKTCPEHHPLFKDPIHVTIFIKSAKYGEKEEIHFVLETIKDRKELEDGHSHFGKHERDYMIEEMDPTPLKQWMFEKLQLDECSKIHLEDIISWNDIGRGEKMKILIDTLERFEDGYELLQRYCEENDKFVYDKVFQKARQQSRTIHKTELGYDKGEGMQKLFSTWIDFSEDPTDPIIPLEVLNMDARSMEMFKEALRFGKEKDFNIRIMVVGPYDVGKTTLIKRLLGKDVNICERQSTEGIDIQTECCKVSLATGEWITQEQNEEQYMTLQRLVKVLNEQVQQKTNDKEQVPKEMETHVISAKQDNLHYQHDLSVRAKQDIDEEVMPSLFQPVESSIAILSPEACSVVEFRENEKKDAIMEIIQLINENSDKLEKSTVEYAKVGMWDFAGQYIFYTTHQAFLSYRAVYLLVIDLSQQITALIEDECFLDTAGLKLCQAQEMINTWMNFIHSCTPSPQSGIPAVILVGTHVDKILEEQLPPKRVKSETQTMTSDTVDFTLPTTATHADTATSEQLRPSTFLGSVWNFLQPWKSKKTVEKTTGSSRTGAHPVTANSQPNTQRIMKKEKVDAENKKKYRHEVCEKYFREIRSYLKDKPTRFHLVDEDFAIDNTVVDSNLLALKQKIVEVASQQPYWGEEVPARWLLLERELMRLKAAGIKVISRTLFEAFNQAEAVPIPTEELDLFLRYQNDIGSILYFSIEVLKDKIVLVPQWMIDAVKSLITAEMFVLRNAPAVAKKWDVFNKSGKLSLELIDAIWTKENYPDLHDNKEHILLLMEHLNIIARPRIFSDDGSEIKEEDYFLAPCMLKEKTPEIVMFPKPDPEMKSSSSILCYNFVGKFLPSPIFHRLLATCVSRWPIAQRKSENQIFCGCCIFSLDLHHRLTVLFREYIIFIHVIRFGTTEKTPSSKLCIEVQEFITKTLTKIIGYLGQSLQFEMSVQCPKSVGYRVDYLIPLADLQGNLSVPCHLHDDTHVIRSQDVLKFWFQEEEPSDAGSSAGAMSALPTSDIERFMYIVYLLVDVGSRVLRQLLHHHTVTSTCTLDQYLAKNLNTINSLRTVFNQSLMDIMFPPNGVATNLDDYDITLLSALFQNIVPTLSQQEKDMIRRLREERKKLFSHARSCQISAKDFQTYWNDISSTLTILSQQCGDIAFEAKIMQEIQCIQIARIPAGFYLDILKTWFDMRESVKDELDSVKNELDSVKDELHNATTRLLALELTKKSSAYDL